ncbi:MAG: hypothetical protein JO257_22070 [Deltaproteobacteria bacterium]|nr:hypothetical protein [Deltaproteobacteria bacterium]
MPDTETLARLVHDGVLRVEDGEPHTTRRWQAAMARAALILRDAKAPADDLRLPIALALVQLYGEQADEFLVADFVAELLPIELAEAGVH